MDTYLVIIILVIMYGLYMTGKTIFTIRRQFHQPFLTILSDYSFLAALTCEIIHIHVAVFPFIVSYLFTGIFLASLFLSILKLKRRVTLRKEVAVNFKNKPVEFLYDGSSLLKERVRKIQEKSHSLLIITDDFTWVPDLKKKLGIELHYNIFPNTVSSEKQINTLYPPGNTLPDLIIIEIQSGKADHYKLFTKLLNSEEYNNIPVIFVAEKATIKEKTYGLALGGIDFIISFKESDELGLKIINILYYQSILHNKNIRDLKSGLFHTIRRNGKKEIEDQFKKYNISSKEKSVIRLLIEDLGYKEIAESLQLSVSGVKKRVNTICQKCGVKGKQELLAIFLNK